MIKYYAHPVNHEVYKVEISQKQFDELGDFTKYFKNTGEEALKEVIYLLNFELSYSNKKIQELREDENNLRSKLNSYIKNELIDGYTEPNEILEWK